MDSFDVAWKVVGVLKVPTNSRRVANVLWRLPLKLVKSEGFNRIVCTFLEVARSVKMCAVTYPILSRQ